MNQHKRNEITRAVEAWRAQNAARLVHDWLWSRPMQWWGRSGRMPYGTQPGDWSPPHPDAAPQRPIWLVDPASLPTFRGTPYEFTTTSGGFDPS